MKTEAQVILEELKTEYNVSDEEIGVRVQKSASAIWRWRKGKSNPSFKEIEFLKKILSLKKTILNNKQKKK